MEPHNGQSTKMAQLTGEKVRRPANENLFSGANAETLPAPENSSHDGEAMIQFQPP